MKRLMFATLSAIGMFLMTPVAAQDFSEEDIKRLAIEAILENPQIVMDAVQILRDREAAQKEADTAQALAENKDTIMDVSNAVVLGNPDGDVTIVEFFDYNCGYCKRAAPAVHDLIDSDSNIRVIYREWPILSEGSVAAAKVSLAARNQGKYEELHWALMDLQQVDEAAALRVAEGLGMDIAQLKIDMESDAVAEHIATSRNITSALGLTGTPSFIVGDTVVPGFVPKESLEELVAKVRAEM
ncbi:hypothetical protein BFP76_01735 [Amylibacter kogurei]|uniref:Thioredoxin domain-containing protein n=1 Tax=Paramylibacter kogurei TaxID=1889778 RepID=A0A2G5K388_9RHOB|nr:DsbA family protein [Amylibacter kogurei]PIB23996.1 hypothetical protein BFP76_01735 [Amylibacter kogurei]